MKIAHQNGDFNGAEEMRRLEVLSFNGTDRNQFLPQVAQETARRAKFTPQFPCVPLASSPPLGDISAVIRCTFHLSCTFIKYGQHLITKLWGSRYMLVFIIRLVAQSQNR